MIVRRRHDVLHLITQPDHAALARRVMERWVPLHDAERRASILLAVEEHDNGWQDPDSAPMVNAEGGVYDFIDTPVAIRQGVWPRGVNRLADDDPWSAALVAQHAATVYDRYRPDAAWTDFFPKMEAMRDALIAAAGRASAQLARDYTFVRIGDLISLIFCNEWNEPQSYDQWQFRRDGDRVLVSPDPFAGREVPIAVRAREIPNVRYESDDALQQAFRASPVVTLSGRVVGV
jgi:hypothetical protein